MARTTPFARARVRAVRFPARKAFAAALAVFLVPLVGSPASLPAAAAPVARAPGDVTNVTLTEVGSSDLASLGLDGMVKRRGQNNDVAVIGNTAFVGGGAVFHGGQSTAGRICTDYGGVKIVDLTTPASPTVTGTITVADTKTVLQGPVGNPRRGQTVNNVASSVSALDAMRHPINGKDVLAIATQRCEQGFFNGGRLEFWDVTNRAAPTLMNVFDGTSITPPFEWGIWEEVNMFTRNNGPGGSTRVYAVTTTPFSVGNSLDLSRNGDFRLLDITNVATAVPTQVSTFPTASVGSNTNNGCKIFSNGRNAWPTPDGASAIFSFYDGAQPANSPIEPTGLSGNLDPADPNDDNPNSAAVFKLDLDNMPVFDSNPSGQLRTWTPTPKSWGYPAAAESGMTAAGIQEGNAADVQPFTGPNGDLYSWVSEDDVDPALTNVSITSPAGLHPDTRGCETPVGKKLYELPGQEVAGQVVYVGRGCPASPLANDTFPVADPYLADPSGKIALIEGGGPGAFFGCSQGDKVKRAAAAGATAAMFTMGCCPPANNGQVTPGGDGPIPTIPTVGVNYRSFNKMAGYIPNRVLAASTFPAPYTRTSSTNVTVRQRALAVTAATNATPIEITTSVAHLLNTGDRVSIYQVPGNTAANGDWAVTVVPPVPPATASTKFTLVGSAGNGASQNGGVVVPCPAGALTCAAQRSDASRFKSVADATDPVAGAQVNATVVTIAAPGVTPPPATPLGTTPLPNATIPVVALPAAIPAGVVIRFANGTQVITAAAALAGATSLVVQQGSPDSIDGPIPAGTTGSMGFDVVAGRSYDAGADLEVEARVAGTFRAAVQWFDAAGALLSDSEIGSLAAVAPRTRFNQAVVAPVGAVRGGIRFEWTGVGAAGTAYADTFSLTPTGLAVNLKDFPGKCDNLTAWPPTPGQCGTPEAAWGAQRIVNFSAAVPTAVTYQSPNSKVWPPPTAGIYAPRQARMFGRDIAFTTWMSDGLRVVDVSNPAAPVERASYVPTGATDPTPTAGAGPTNRRDGSPIVRGPSWPDAPLVHGVDIIPTGAGTGYAVLSDINAGLKVVRFVITRQGEEGLYTPLTPARVLDTRNATGAPQAKLAAGATLELQITGQGGVPESGVSAVVLNLTAIAPTAPSFVTAWPSGTTRPLAANVNFPGTPGEQVVENLVKVKVGANGRVSLYNNGGTVDLGADVAGWYADEANLAGTRYNAITPARVLDTRNGTGAPMAKVGAAASIDLQVTGAGGVPLTGVSAVVLNVTAIAPTAASFLTAYPTGVPRPLAANANYVAGELVTNRVVVKVGTGGKVTLYNHAGQVDLGADMVGWYSTDSAPPGAAFRSQNPTRILDTRNGTGAPLAKVGPAGVLNVQITGQAGIPASGVSAVVLNLTAIAPTGPSFVTAWPTGVARPLAADLNFVTNQTISNLVVVKVGTGGMISLFNFSGQIDLGADVAGYFVE